MRYATRNPPGRPLVRNASQSATARPRHRRDASRHDSPLRRCAKGRGGSRRRLKQVENARFGSSSRTGRHDRRFSRSRLGSVFSDHQTGIYSSNRRLDFIPKGGLTSPATSSRSHRQRLPSMARPEGCRNRHDQRICERTPSPRRSRKSKSQGSSWGQRLARWGSRRHGAAGRGPVGLGTTVGSSRARLAHKPCSVRTSW